MLITISNLFPRPDQPTRGLYNFYLFKEIARIQDSGFRIQNICLVPEWRVWKWRAIRRWNFPFTADCRLPTSYLPVFYLPFLGRSLNWWFYYRALRGKYADHDKIHAPVWGGCPHPPSAVRGRQADGDIRPTRDIRPTDTPTFYVPWLYPDGVAVALAIRGTGARLWLMALGSDTFHLKAPCRRRKIVAACEQAEGIVCVAQVLADRLAAIGVPLAKLHVVPNGVDTSLFRVRSEEELLSVGASGTPLTTEQLNNSKLILFVGNLVPVKGPDVMLRAFAALRENEVQVAAERHRLLIIGSGPMKVSLEGLAKELGIADRVKFLGRRSREEVALWMSKADVLCLSSRSEGMPNVVLEARASGLPVVTTPSGAIPELPLDKEHFLVVKSSDPADLAEGLREMLSRDLSVRKSDPIIPTWAMQAESILKLMRRPDER